MPQKFLSIKNFDKYQTSTNKESRPWIKLYKSILGDPEFMKLSTHCRFLYTGLLLLADECGNKIYNDRTYIGQRLYIPHTEVDLRPLYRAGFLETSNLPRTLSDLRIREDLRSKIKIEDSAASPTPLKPPLSKREKLEAFELEHADRRWALAKLEIQNADDYVDEFKDYWRAVDDRKLKSDWHATFRNRLRYLKDHNQLKANVWS